MPSPSHPEPVAPCVRQALELLQASADLPEVELDLVYGYIPADNHEFDPSSGLYIPVKPVEKPMGIVRRSLSFGKKKKSASSAAAPPAPAEVKPFSTKPRRITIKKNEQGMIMVTDLRA